MLLSELKNYSKFTRRLPQRWLSRFKQINEVPTFHHFWDTREIRCMKNRQEQRNFVDLFENVMPFNFSIKILTLIWGLTFYVKGDFLYRHGEYLKHERTSGDFYSKRRSMFFEKYPRGIAGHIQSNLCSRSEKANKTIRRQKYEYQRSFFWYYILSLSE